MTGRVVVVTGAASGIGRALAELLLSRGDEVHSVDRYPGIDGARTHLVDLAEPAALPALAGELPATIGALALVAGLPGTRPALDVLAVNALAPRLLTALLVERMPADGAIVAVGSVAADRNTVPDEGIDELGRVSDRVGLAAWLDRHRLGDAAAYDSSKRALRDWARGFAAERIGRGPRVLSVSPGPIETPILPDFVASMGATAIDRAEAAVGRHGRAAEVAAAVAAMLAPELSWVNGIDLVVDGGLGAVRAATLNGPSLDEREVWA